MEIILDKIKWRRENTISVSDTLYYRQYNSENYERSFVSSSPLGFIVFYETEWKTNSGITKMTCIEIIVDGIKYWSFTDHTDLVKSRIKLISRIFIKGVMKIKEEIVSIQQ